MRGEAYPQADDFTVDGHLQGDALHGALKAACRKLLPGWGELSDERMEVGLISGGISNALFKLTPSAGAAGLAPVALRVYGDSTQHFVDRERELALMSLLHSQGFGPKLLATFGNGRMEEFLPMRCLAPEEMSAPGTAARIAAALRRFHDTPAPGPREGAAPFARIRQWLDTAEGFIFEEPQRQALFESFDFARLRAEAVRLEAACAPAASPAVFAHNDLLSGNIMVPLSEPPSGGGNAAGGAAAPADGGHAVAEGGEMTFIDFEYSDWAPRGFDLGNHFCEYAGFDCDYTRYPGTAAAATFVRAYLAAGGGGGGSGAGPSEAEVAAVVAEANLYSLAAHMFWGTWSFLQAKWSTIDFDYLSYAKLRWDEYHRRRDEFMAAGAKAFGPPAAAAAAGEGEQH